MSNDNNFGVFLRKKREEMRLSLMELSSRCGINYSALSNIETGKRPPPIEDNKLALLARAMKIKPGLLKSRAAKSRKEARFNLSGASDDAVEEVLALCAKWPDICGNWPDKKIKETETDDGS